MWSRAIHVVYTDVPFIARWKLNTVEYYIWYTFRATSPVFFYKKKLWRKITDLILVAVRTAENENGMLKNHRIYA